MSYLTFAFEIDHQDTEHDAAFLLQPDALIHSCHMMHLQQDNSYFENFVHGTAAVECLEAVVG